MMFGIKGTPCAVAPGEACGPFLERITEATVLFGGLLGVVGPAQGLTVEFIERSPSLLPR